MTLHPIRSVPLILASRSPRRRRLLQQAGFRFRVVSSTIEERFNRHESPARNAKRIALEKALDVASKVRSGVVVGADTIVVVNGRILGKPRTSKEARRMLSLLSGRMHTVYTGFALVDASTGRSVVEVEKTRVWFRRLSNGEIDSYIRSGSPFDKAGGYGIQDDHGALFVEKVEGCFYNVVGFPLTKFYVTLRKFLKSNK
jgi:septum formation protein